MSLAAIVVVLSTPPTASAAETGTLSEETPTDGTAPLADEPEADPDAPASNRAATDDESEQASRRDSRRTLRVSSAKTSPKKIYLGGRRDAKFRFELNGNRNRKLLVKAVHVKSGKVKKRWRLGSVRPGERKRIAWNGKKGGRKAGFTRQGKHAFRVFSGGDRAKISKKSGGQRFGFYKHRFPVRGRHTYGDGMGAGRGHQGQDIFARCGRPIVAARGGRVQTKAYQSSAGYYVVIDGRGTGRDYVYMHLEKRKRPRQGSWVKTGERIGYNSDTGNASGCHLHFELWSGPGWYQGGRAKSPTKALRRWDRWS